jgi:hypothetical protein
MTNRLPVFGCLAHDPQGILAAVYWLALVDLELYRISAYRFERLVRFLTMVMAIGSCNKAGLNQKHDPDHEYHRLRFPDRGVSRITRK